MLDKFTAIANNRTDMTPEDITNIQLRKSENTTGVEVVLTFSNTKADVIKDVADDFDKGDDKSKSVSVAGKVYTPQTITFATESVEVTAAQNPGGSVAGVASSGITGERVLFQFVPFSGQAEFEYLVPFPDLGAPVSEIIRAFRIEFGKALAKHGYEADHRTEVNLQVENGIANGFGVTVLDIIKAQRDELGEALCTLCVQVLHYKACPTIVSTDPSYDTSSVPTCESVLVKPTGEGTADADASSADAASDNSMSAGTSVGIVMSVVLVAALVMSVYGMSKYLKRGTNNKVSPEGVGSAAAESGTASGPDGEVRTSTSSFTAGLQALQLLQAQPCIPMDHTDSQNAGATSSPGVGTGNDAGSPHLAKALAMAQAQASVSQGRSDADATARVGALPPLQSGGVVQPGEQLPALPHGAEAESSVAGATKAASTAQQPVNYVKKRKPASSVHKKLTRLSKKHSSNLVPYTAPQPSSGVGAADVLEGSPAASAQAALVTMGFDAGCAAAVLQSLGAVSNTAAAATNTANTTSTGSDISSQVHLLQKAGRQDHRLATGVKGARGAGALPSLRAEAHVPNGTPTHNASSENPKRKPRSKNKPSTSGKASSEAKARAAAALGSEEGAGGGRQKRLSNSVGSLPPQLKLSPYTATQPLQQRVSTGGALPPPLTLSPYQAGGASRADKPKKRSRRKPAAASSAGGLWKPPKASSGLPATSAVGWMPPTQ